MSKNSFDIEIQEEIIRTKNDAQIPENCLLFGEIKSDDVTVFIKQDVYKALEALSTSDISKELGSIIFGDYRQDETKTYVIVSDYVEAKHTDASASTLTFTHKTWSHVHKEHAKRFSDKAMIGWQHTHPGYGIFLSNYDMFIQENFFDMPFQIAYVIDPIQNLRGFFQWKNGKVEKLKGYYIYDEPGKPIKLSPSKAFPLTEVQKSRKSKTLFATVAILYVSTAILAWSTLYYSRKYNHVSNQIAHMTAESDSQNKKIAQQANIISELETRLLNNIIGTKDATTATELIELLENNENILPNQEELLKELKKFVAQENNSNVKLKFISHVVVQGESLTDICDANNIDYSSNLNIILTMNGISDANRIYVGQTILLPIAEQN